VLVCRSRLRATLNHETPELSPERSMLMVCSGSGMLRFGDAGLGDTGLGDAEVDVARMGSSTATPSLGARRC